MSGDNQRSAVNVQQHVESMKPEQLCDWLKPQLEEVDWKDVIRVIQGQKIKGADFLEYTHDKWVRHPYNLLGGVANSLEKLAEKAKKCSTSKVPLDYDAVEVHGGRLRLSDVMKVLRRVVEESDVLPGKDFKNKFRNGSGECKDFWMAIDRELTAKEETIINELIVVYERMKVDDKFCLGTNFVEDKKRASEMLLDACVGFLGIDFPLLQETKFFIKDNHLYYNKNAEWTPPHLFEKGEGSNVFHKWKPKCDGALSCRPSGDDEHFEFLLVLSEHSRDDVNKDIDKIRALLTASADTIQLCVSGQELDSPIYLCCLSLQGLKLHLHVMEVKVDDATFYASAKVFDCNKSKEYREAIECSWMIAKYASVLAGKIRGWSEKFRSSGVFTDLLEGRQSRTRPSESNAPSSSRHSAPGGMKPPLAGGVNGKKGRVGTGGADHVARLEEVTDLLLNTGEFFDVEPMFAICVQYSSHIEMNPRVDRILIATHGDNRDAVVVKKVSPSEFNYVKKLKERVHSLTKSPQSIGFLFPESFKDFGDSMKFLVFKKIRPLSSLCFDDLGLVEKIYNQLLTFMRFCQAHLIVHGDLKLSNLGLDEENSLCVFDWEERVDGTEGYMAPEVALRSTKPNALSDIYSAGILLKEIVDKTDHSEVMDQVRLQRLRLAIWSMLARGPEKRKLVDLESIKLTRSDTWSASEESGSSGSVMPEKRRRMVDRSHAMTMVTT